MTRDDLPDRLTELARRPPAHDHRWTEPARLRLRATRRRRARWAGVLASCLAVALAVSLSLVLPGGGSPDPQPPAGLHVAAGIHVAGRSGPAALLVSDVSGDGTGHPADAAARAAVARAEQQFAFALLGQLAGRGERNVAVSPMGLATVLTMLENGAAGPTRTQIAHALQTAGLGLGRQNAGWAALGADLERAGARAGLTMQTANSLWLQRNLPLAQQFMDTLARDYGAGVWQVDFARRTGAAIRAINEWVRERTHGRIDTLFRPGSIDASTRLVLANAIYFKATWRYEFDRDRTRDDTFVTGSGRHVTTAFMSFGDDPPKLRTANTPDYTAVQLPYAGNRFAALVVMPKQQSLPGFVAALTPTALGRIMSGLQLRKTALQLPKFTLEKDIPLKPVLEKMGMADAFGSGADFSAMSPTPLSVRTIEQRTFVKVDESGTEATSVTGAAAATGARIPTTIDHPFLFMIRDTETGAILFAAQVNNPAA